MVRALLLITLCAGVATCSLPAWGESSTSHRSPHTSGTKWIAGTRIVTLNVIGAENRETAWGPGLSLERNIVEGWLESELAVATVWQNGHLTVPLDFILKKPFHFGPACPYVGVGIALSVQTEATTEVYAGVSAVLGAYFWLGEHTAIDVEFEYNLVAEDGTVHEIVVGVGPAFRF